MKNACETHVIVNLENGKTFGVRSDNEVRYADITSGVEGMTMVVRLSRGPNARVQTLFLIFKNKNRNYRIRGLPDTLPIFVYRAGLKGWMGEKNMLSRLKAPLLIKSLSYNRICTLHIDNCSSHILSEDVCQLTARREWYHVHTKGNDTLWYVTQHEREVGRVPAQARAPNYHQQTLCFV